MLFFFRSLSLDNFFGIIDNHLLINDFYLCYG